MTIRRRAFSPMAEPPIGVPPYAGSPQRKHGKTRRQTQSAGISLCATPTRKESTEQDLTRCPRDPAPPCEGDAVLGLVDGGLAKVPLEAEAHGLLREYLSGQRDQEGKQSWPVRQLHGGQGRCGH
jgi:hypothetical protein